MMRLLRRILRGGTPIRWMLTVAIVAGTLMTLLPAKPARALLAQRFDRVL